MAKIIYKEGCEGQKKLSSIEGIEIDLLNRQKALIYPKYAERKVIKPEQISMWTASAETEIGALRVEDINGKTEELLKIGSPAAEWVSQFRSEQYGNFCLSSILSGMEILRQKEEIDALAETIEGADLLRNYISGVCSCSRCGDTGYWCAYSVGFAGYTSCRSAYVAVPTILYRKIEK